MKDIYIRFLIVGEIGEPTPFVLLQKLLLFSHVS